FITLGKASLQVFCAHLFFVFVGLALLYGQIEQLHGWTAVILVSVTFVSLMIVAIREVSKRNRKRNQPPPPQIAQAQGVSQ
ncbi:MAG TPA: OpgC domain-containing protein, partial [Acidobacteriaceae bacterium]|nr:OpgC domain-containing protein [Acidobacteriaceae bacterium]